MSERLINQQVNQLINEFLATKGTLTDLSNALGINLSTLWRYRSKGFTDPYAVFVIAKASGKTEEEAQSLAKEIFVANGGNPDVPLSRRRGGRRVERMRDEIRELIQEELSKALATKAS